MIDVPRVANFCPQSEKSYRVRCRCFTDTLTSLSHSVAWVNGSLRDKTASNYSAALTQYWLMTDRETDRQAQGQD